MTKEDLEAWRAQIDMCQTHSMLNRTRDVLYQIPGGWRELEGAILAKRADLNSRHPGIRYPIQPKI